MVTKGGKFHPNRDILFYYQFFTNITSRMSLFVLGSSCTKVFAFAHTDEKITFTTFHGVFIIDSRLFDI